MDSEETNTKAVNENEDKDTLDLGGIIHLSGFSDMDGASMVVLKKIIGNHVKRISSKANDLEGVYLNMKKIHEKEDNAILQINGKLIDKGKVFTSEVEDRNLFVGIDSIMKKLSVSMGLDK